MKSQFFDKFRFVSIPLFCLKKAHYFLFTEIIYQKNASIRKIYLPSLAVCFSFISFVWEKQSNTSALAIATCPVWWTTTRCSTTGAIFQPRFYCHWLPGLRSSNIFWPYHYFYSWLPALPYSILILLLIHHENECRFLDLHWLLSLWNCLYPSWTEIFSVM